MLLEVFLEIWLETGGGGSTDTGGPPKKRAEQ
jgi:hypothetical protein